MTWKNSKVKSTEKIKAISGGLSGYQTSVNDLSAKLDYLENQSRRSNVIIEGIPDTKMESWSDIKIEAKKSFTDHLKIDPKLIEIERAHCGGKYDPVGCQDRQC